MASYSFGDAPDTEPLTAPRRPAAAHRPPPGLWSSLLARLRPEPVAAPFHDSDFEPTEWSATHPALDPEPRRRR
jgi:hypothetical protein